MFSARVEVAVAVPVVLEVPSLSRWGALLFALFLLLAAFQRGVPKT